MVNVYKVVRSGFVPGEMRDIKGKTYFNDKLAHGKFQDGSTIMYYQNGLFHNETGPAMIMKDRKNGTTKIYYVNGKFIRSEVRANLSCKEFICDGMKHKVTHIKEIWDNKGKVFYDFYRSHKLLMRVEKKS